MTTTSPDPTKATDATAPVQISCVFDSGNIEVVDATDPKAGIVLSIRPDVYTELEKKAHRQWFHFKASGGRPGDRFIISNAGVCSFPAAWPGTTVCYSVDRQEWKRAVDTTYDQSKGTLEWTWPAAARESFHIWFAYFAPYSWEQHQDLIGRSSASPLCKSKILGRTLDGRDLDLLIIGTGKTKAWVIHRQHPGESQAEFYAEGLVERLLDTNDAVARNIRESCTVYIVPNMNPDGSVRGHLRTNACGANLNREWSTTGEYEAPTLHRSPEVYHVLKEMDTTGVDFFVDVHGDEEIPMNFVSGMEGTPNWGPRKQWLQGAFVNRLSIVNPDFQKEISYEPNKDGQANLAICSNQISHRFDCLGVTLEQPFKDCATLPDPERGWSPIRCKRLGASLLDVLAYVRPYLRATGEFWKDLHPSDAYVAPVEGGATSSLPNRSAGKVFDTDSEIRSLDEEVAQAEQLIAQLRTKRTALAASPPKSKRIALAT